MSKALTEMLFGKWEPPKGVPSRRNFCMKGMAQSERFESEAYVNVQIEILRFMRDFKNKWFSPAEVKLNIKTRFSSGGLGVVMRKMVEDEFLLSQQSKKNRRLFLYKFNGTEK